MPVQKHSAQDGIAGIWTLHLETVREAQQQLAYNKVTWRRPRLFNRHCSLLPSIKTDVRLSGRSARETESASDNVVWMWRSQRDTSRDVFLSSIIRPPVAQ